MKHLKIEDIIKSIDLNDEFLDMVKNFVTDNRGSVILENEGDLPLDPKIKTLAELEEGLCKATVCDLVKIKTNIYTAGIERFTYVILDLFGHSGVPGGEKDLYLARVAFEIEDTALILSLINVVKYN